MPSYNDRPNSPFTDEEEDCRDVIRAFLDDVLEPNHEKFVGDLEYDKEFWRSAGRAGILGAMLPEELGGPDLSPSVSIILSQELGRSVGAATIGSSLEADMATHLLVDHAPEEWRERLAPGILSGEVMQSVAITEPNAGSDITAIRMTAVRDGDEYVLNGSKVFISNANKANIIYVAVKTDPSRRGSGMSVIIVEGDAPGLTRSPLKTMGCAAYDVAELHFDDVRVPAANLVGSEGTAMSILMGTLMLDRLQISARALGEAELALRLTIEHVKDREAFGHAIFDYQNTQFVLADMKTEIEASRAMLHDGVRRMTAGTLEHPDASMVKLFVTQTSARIIDRALQLFGGYGFMDEMPISRIYTANRIHRLYVGTDEMQKITIARSL